MASLTNKVALITGASRGIGAAIATRLAQDGADVAITYSASPAKAEQLVASLTALGRKAIAVRADSGHTEAVRSAVQSVAAHFGRIDILVNNAGVAHLAPIADFSDEDFNRLLNINVRGVFAATRESVRHMPDGGRIIMIGSVNSDLVPFPNGSVYALTKGAVAAFTHGLARELGPRAITVNNIQPGPIATDMNPEDGPFAETLRRTLAVGRYGKPEEVAALVAHLAGPEAGYITGAQIKIDGGFAA